VVLEALSTNIKNPKPLLTAWCHADCNHLLVENGSAWCVYIPTSRKEFTSRFRTWRDDRMSRAKEVVSEYIKEADNAFERQQDTLSSHLPAGYLFCVLGMVLGKRKGLEGEQPSSP